MRASPPANLNSLSASTATFRAPPDPNAQDEDSHSSSSNSPTRPDYEESDFFAGNNDSNSSIGIPTFDAMSVGTEPAACLPPINRLPAEILINIFNKLNTPSDLLNCLLTSKSWARNCVDLLWLRPACTTWPKHGAICRTLILPDPYFAYRDFVKRLNLAGLADRVNDGSVLPLAACTRVERLTLTSCVGLTDQGLIGLVSNNKQLLALDISGDVNITEAAIDVLAENCRILQGLNVSGCIRISNEAMIRVAQNCKKLKRVCTVVLWSMV
jgi:F-box and leucine-rich repeat protein GRR1